MIIYFIFSILFNCYNVFLNTNLFTIELLNVQPVFNWKEFVLSMFEEQWHKYCLVLFLEKILWFQKSKKTSVLCD